MNSTKSTIVWPATHFALLGAFLSAILLAEFGAGTFGLGVPEGASDVLASRWAVFPPADLADSATLRVPVALIGVIYFVGMALWLIVVGRLSWTQRLWHSLPMGVALMGGLVSLALTTGLVLLNAWCPLCLAVHGVNLALVPYIYLCRPERGPDDADAATVELRPVLLGLALAACAGAAVWFGWESFLVHQQNRALTAALQEAAAETEAVALKAPTATVRPAEIVRAEPVAAVRQVEVPAGWVLDSNSPNAVTVVVFADLINPECRAFQQRLFDEIAPKFQGNLRLAFKHFPYCAASNPDAGSEHPTSCDAAYLAESGRQQGGAAAFLQVVQSISPGRTESWSDEDVIRLALDLGLNPQKFVEDWHGAVVRRRVADDVAQGQQLGVTEVPTVYVNGQRLDSKQRDRSDYWDQLVSNPRSSGQPAVASVVEDPAPKAGDSVVVLEAQPVTLQPATPPQPTPSPQPATPQPAPTPQPATPQPVVKPAAPTPEAEPTPPASNSAKPAANAFATTPAAVLAQGLIKRYDSNTDGVLQVEEYAKIPGDFAKYDTDLDGDVSAGELSAAIAVAQRLKQSAAAKQLP